MKKESVFQSRVVLLIPFLFLAAAYAWRQSSFPAYTGDDVAFFAYALNEGSLWQFHSATLSNVDEPCSVGAHYGAHPTGAGWSISMACGQRAVCCVPLRGLHFKWRAA